MKRKISGILFIILTLTFFVACEREEFMDIYSFAERYGNSELSVEDFYIGDSEGVYFTFFEKATPKVMLKAICNNKNIIEEIRIYIPKYDENANKKEILTDDIRIFVRTVINSIKAFTGCSEAQAEEIASEMCLYQKKSFENEGELTKTKGCFHFVYHSASPGSEFIIYNTYLKNVPQTEKPESRPIYGDTTKIRTETVPTK